ncbi:MAG: hypothetical protein GY773_20415, partial [Actinomycetia bacterium]|nr:hypothetical protein [Actinomycetes bacterium]
MRNFDRRLERAAERYERDQGVDGISYRIEKVADQTPLAYGEILVALIQAYGLQMGPTIPFPVSIVQALSPFIDSDMTFRFLSGFLSPMWKRVQERHKLTGPLEPNVYRAGLAYLQGDRVVVTDKLTALGWQPKWPDLRQGMAQTVRWYQQARWVPDYRALPDEDILDEGIGLSYRERLDAQNGHLELTVTFPSLRRLALDQDAILEGTISLDGIATEAELV